MANVRGRFAPSPTGHLHLGNARTALLAWLQARQAGGDFLLRVEDLDPERSRAELEAEQQEDLRYLGLTWDEPPLRQSERAPRYAAALEQLRAQDAVYPCFCSRTEIAQSASAPHGPEGPRYPGTCAHLNQAQRAERRRTRAPAWRFRVPPGTVRFDDAIRGACEADVAREGGDFVVCRADGVASYQLAVVVDDAASGITHVVRGDDLLPSTPRQLLLQGALGLPTPRYAHVPLLLAPGGARLAKREGGDTVRALRERGVPAAAVIGLLAHSVGLGGGAPATAAEFVPGFSLSHLRADVMPLPDLFARGIGSSSAS